MLAESGGRDCGRAEELGGPPHLITPDRFSAPIATTVTRPLSTRPEIQPMAF